FFLGIIVTNFIAGERLLRRMNARRSENTAAFRRLVIILNASLVAFAIGGAFLSAVYYPHVYLLAALLECGRALGEKSLAAEATAHRSEGDVSLAYRGVAV
ncbi:MAG TPA: hypothetical protein VLS44_04485, partial [Nitrospira sp.]|nr:hypothetical protein [Nitrospira sp.]